STRRYTRSKRDWSSDVCSSDLESIHFHVIIWIILFEFRQQIKDLASLLPLKFRTLLLNDRLIPSFLVDLITDMRFSLTLLLNERSEEHTSELQSRFDLVCRLLL